jgi:hypothetical protein
MPRSHGVSVQNKFIKGLITEGTALSFPEDACTETFNCVFDHLGRVTRRLGIDLEGGKVTRTSDMANGVTVTYLWKNVGGDGDINYAVVQNGFTLIFYRVLSSAALSAGLHANTVTLTTFSSVAASTVQSQECQFAQGNGFLFVTHPSCEPFYVSYDIAGNTFTATQINLKERDFVGITSDNVQDQERPTSLTDAHRYNLANQGWPSSFLGQSATSITIGTGSKVFTTAATLSILVGDRVRVYSRATPGSLGASTSTGNIMIGTVTAYAGTSLTVNVTSTNGAGTLSDWNIVQEPDYQEAWNILYGNYPNNCDVWWAYKNTSGIFGPSTEFMNSFPGLGLAPKGHFILGVFSADRAVASGITGLTVVTTGTARPSTCSFFAGRVFYGGIQSQGYNARIYFSQILSNISQAGKCYQVNDPTSEEAFDLLPSDGGFIDILEAGQILKLVPYLNSLIVIATNGVWSITGSQGLGFVATDYSIHKISAIPSSSANSLVDVDGVPIWWTSDGIFQITSDPQTGQLGVQNMINQSILTFFQNIPLEGRRFARGTYDPEDHKVHWVYRSIASSKFSDKYIYDQALTFNLLSKSFYPWSISTTNGRIHGVVAVRTQGGTFTLSNVSAASGVNNVQAASGANQVIVFSAPTNTTGNSGTIVKYLCSYAPTGVLETANLTFAESYQTTYKDWASTSGGSVDYTSYLVTGHRIHGEAIRKFQTNYVNFFSDADATNTQFKVRGQWDFSTSGSSGRDSTVQVVSGLFKAKPKRLKIRGHGRSMQFRIESVSGQPFSVIGWSAFETANSWV